MSGRGYILLYGLSLAFLNALVKHLDRIPVHELVFFRNAGMGVVTFAALYLKRIPYFGNNKKMLIFRGLAGLFFVYFFYEALQRMPLASATSLHYTFPIISIVLSSIFLKERPSLRQWFFFVMAFGGVLMVKEFDPRVNFIGLLCALISAFAVAVVAVSIRALRTTEHPLVVMFYLPLVALVVATPYTATHWVSPTATEWLALLATGVLTSIVQFFMTQAYSNDAVSRLSNYNYLTVVYSLLIGFFFFGESVKPMSLLGMAVIVVATILGAPPREQKA